MNGHEMRAKENNHTRNINRIEREVRWVEKHTPGGRFAALILKEEIGLWRFPCL